MRDKCVEMSDNANKMRDRLVELFKKIEKEPAITCPAYKTDKTCKDCKYSINDSLCNHIERQVDYLLANGVVALPCKVGDIIWVKDYERNCEIQKAEIIAILKNRYGTYIRYEYPAFRGQVYARNVEYIGKDVFLTKEEAERALKGGE